jgi:hypothetical protein
MDKERNTDMTDKPNEPQTETLNDEWGELDLADSQVVTTPENACRIGDPECESCQ